MVHRNRNGEQSADRTTMNAYNLKDIITSKRRPAIVVPGYRFSKDIALYSAILVADLKQDGDKESLCKMDHLLRRPSSLEKLVSKRSDLSLVTRSIYQTILKQYNSGVTFTRRT